MRAGCGDTPYVGCGFGNGGIGETNTPIRLTDVLDGTSNTFMIGEAMTELDYQLEGYRVLFEAVERQGLAGNRQG